MTRLSRAALLAALLAWLPVVHAADPLAPLVRVLDTTNDPATQRDVLRGMLAALRGRRGVKAPAGWDGVFRELAFSADPEVRLEVRVLSVLFGDEGAVAELRRTVGDGKAPDDVRRASLAALLERPGPDLLPVLRAALDDPAVRGGALRGLASLNAADTPALVLKRYAALPVGEKADALATLASRPAYALALLDAVEAKQVPRGDVTPFLARQIGTMKDAKVKARLAAVWGTVRPAGADKEKLLARYQGLATPEALKKSDRSAGRAIFQKSCASCHVLFDAGGKIGPDLTGSQRAKPEYVLTKVLDPHAVVPRDYQVTVLTLASGRIVTGVIKEEGKVLVIQTATEELRLPAGDVEDRQRLAQSLMPEGLLQMLGDDQVRDLLAYLAGPTQVPAKE